MSKEKCINEISMLSIVKRSMQQLLKEQDIVKGSVETLHELKIEKGERSELYASTIKGIMGILHSVHPSSRPDLYRRRLIDETTEIPKNALVMEEEKYLREADGFKVKRKTKVHLHQHVCRDRVTS